MKFDEDFKWAIKGLPVAEKDKLLLRLLKHDPVLVQQLQFKLVETKSVDMKRAEMEDKIESWLTAMLKDDYAPNYLLYDLRHLSSEISLHVKVTKDKFGEVYLNLRMLVSLLSRYIDTLNKEKYGHARKFCTYVVAKTFNLLVLNRKLHEDWRYDLRNDFEELGRLFGQCDHLMRTAIYHGLDANWLFDNHVPENLADIQKDLRQRGFLK